MTLKFLRPQSVSQNREEKRGQCNFLVSNCWKRCFPVETLRGAILSGWILLFQTIPLEDFLENVGRSFSRREKGTMRQYDNGAIRRTASLLPFLCTPLPQFPISLDEPINFIKVSFAHLTNKILVI